MVKRCDWAKGELLSEYHDREWGVIVFDDRIHFEQICLSGFQAGLSWELILRKRPYLRRAFLRFDPARVSRLDSVEVSRITGDQRGIRNIKKIKSVVNNAQRFLDMQRQNKGSFSRYLFAQLKNRAVSNDYHSWTEIPSRTKDSIKISNFLVKKGFTFCGPTIVYAYLQSIGFVEDHIKDCFRKKQLKKYKDSF